MSDVDGSIPADRGVSEFSARRSAGRAGFGTSASVIRVKKSKSSCDKCVFAAETEACSFRRRTAAALDDAGAEAGGVEALFPIRTPTLVPERSSWI